jgi:hypothetical protein
MKIMMRKLLTKWSCLPIFTMSKSSKKTLDLNFPDEFDTTTASAKDYFDLMSDTNIMTDFVKHTNTYSKCNIKQSGEGNSVFTQVKPICDLLCCVRENNFFCIIWPG